MKNPDQALLRGFAQEDGPGQPMDTSPLLIALGCELEKVDPGAGVVQLRFTPSGQFLQGAGVLQGGAVTSMLDFAMCFAGLACVADGQTAATVNLNVAFQRAAKMGTYTAVGEVERLGRTLVFTRGRLLDSDGQLIATATSTLTVFGA